MISAPEVKETYLNEVTTGDIIVPVRKHGIRDYTGIPTKVNTYSDIAV